MKIDEDRKKIELVDWAIVPNQKSVKSVKE
jgi:hypothetical protein